MTLWSVSKLVAATLVLALLSRGFTEHWSLFIALCCFIESSVVLGFSGDTPARGLLNPAVFLLSACQPGPSAWTCPCRSAPTVRDGALFLTPSAAPTCRVTLSHQSGSPTGCLTSVLETVATPEGQQLQLLRWRLCHLSSTGL